MIYTKPKIISYSEEELEKAMVAYASCGATYCSIGTRWGNTCGSAITYCPSNASYDGGGITCPAGANYGGGWNLPHN